MDKFIIYLMVIFAALGAIDKITGNKFGLGKQFEEGITAIGSLALSMVGIISLSPVIAKFLRPAVVPVYTFLGADPAMFAGTILANDMGGASLAKDLAINPDAGRFAGLIVGSMMGATIVFTIPVALGIIKESDRKYLATGVLSGIITIPVGSFFGGIIAGFEALTVIKNLVPIIIIAILIAFGLWKFENAMIKGFTLFGKFVVAVITIGLILGIIEELTGFAILPGMNPISDGFSTVADICIVLSGAFPLVFVITKVFKKPLMKLGHLLGMNDVSAAGIVASLANSIPMFQMMKDMDNRGKVINVAFSVSAAFVFGDHLGFTAGFDSSMIVPMIAGKLISGTAAIFVALFISKKFHNTEDAK